MSIWKSFRPNFEMFVLAVSVLPAASVGAQPRLTVAVHLASRELNTYVQEATFTQGVYTVRPREMGDVVIEDYDFGAVVAGALVKKLSGDSWQPTLPAPALAIDVEALWEDKDRKNGFRAIPDADYVLLVRMGRYAAGRSASGKVFVSTSAEVKLINSVKGKQVWRKKDGFQASVETPLSLDELTSDEHRDELKQRLQTLADELSAEIETEARKAKVRRN